MLFLPGDQKLNLSPEADGGRDQDCSLKEEKDGCTLPSAVDIEWPVIAQGSGMLRKDQVALSVRPMEDVLSFFFLDYYLLF